MQIEAICAHRGVHPEYLIRANHKDVMQLGGTTFKPGETLSVAHALMGIDNAMNQLRYAQRAANLMPDMIEAVEVMRAEKAGPVWQTAYERLLELARA